MRMHAWALVSSQACGFLCEKALLLLRISRARLPGHFEQNVSDKGADLLPHLGCSFFEMRQKCANAHRGVDGVGVMTVCFFVVVENIIVTTKT